MVRGVRSLAHENKINRSYILSNYGMQYGRISVVFNQNRKNIEYYQKSP